MNTIERICKDIRRKLDDMTQPGVWELYTRHMEGGEYREFVQYYRDLETILSVLERSVWISVEDRLPEDNVQVLVCTRHGKAFPAHCENGKWRVSGSVKVTHWTPMPKSPKED